VSELVDCIPSFCRLGDLRSSNQVDTHEINQKVGQGRGGVGSYFRRPEEALTSSHWQVCTVTYLYLYIWLFFCNHIKLSFRPFQIIQLVPSPQSGQFFAWVVVEGLMLKIPLSIPRVFYINSKVPIDEYFQGKCVNKILPHGRPCYSLTEACVLTSIHLSPCIPSS